MLPMHTCKAETMSFRHSLSTCQDLFVTASLFCLCHCKKINNLDRQYVYTVRRYQLIRRYQCTQFEYILNITVQGMQTFVKISQAHQYFPVCLTQKLHIIIYSRALSMQAFKKRPKKHLRGTSHSAGLKIRSSFERLKKKGCTIGCNVHHGIRHDSECRLIFV